MRAPAFRAFEFEDHLSCVDLVDVVGEPPVALAATNVSLENRCHETARPLDRYSRSRRPSFFAGPIQGPFLTRSAPKCALHKGICQGMELNLRVARTPAYHPNRLFYAPTGDGTRGLKSYVQKGPLEQNPCDS